MEKDFKKKVIKPLCIYSLAFSMLLPSLTGVVEAASDLKESNTEKIVAKIAEKKKEVQEDKTEVKEAKKEVKETKAEVKEEKTKPEAKKDLEDILTEDEIQEIRTRANSLENSYFFNGNMVEELKAELRKAKADSSVNYQEAKARLINEAIIKNTPVQKAPGQDRTSIVVTMYTNGNAIKAGVDKIGFRSRDLKKGHRIVVYVNNFKRGELTLTRDDTRPSVTLESKLKAGDVVEAEVYDDQGIKVADIAQYTVPKSKADEYKNKIKMPTGEIWIEQYVANIPNADEKAEALELLKAANPDIANDIKSVEFKIAGVDPKTASYTVTYTDDSKTEEIQAPGLIVNKVTETSRAAKLSDITVVDNVIKGKLEGEGPFDGIKVQLVINVKKEKSGDFCTDKGCKIDKDSSNPVGVTLQKDGSFSYTLQGLEKLELDQIVGVSVKEPHKFVSCSTTTVKPVKVDKKEVRDPRKLTSEDKKAIDAAIRKAYTVNGVSKLPDGNPGTDWAGIPAVIQIDDSGNVKIFSATDAVVNNWDDDGNAIPDKNEDGSVKLNDGAQPVITIQGKELLKNIKPEAPTLASSKDNKSITITPNEKDTDAKIITVSYKDKDGKDQTTTATKDDNGTWSIAGEGTVVKGVITLPKDKVKGGTDVTAKVTDKGGVADDDTTPLESDPGTLKVEETKADKVKALGGLDPVVMKKWVGDKIEEGFWKEGVKAKDSKKETEVNNLLAGATFEDATDTARTTKTAGKYEGKIKVKFDDGSEIVVKNQKLYVSDHVTWFSKKETPGGKVVLNENTPDDALVVEFKLGEGTKVDNTGSGAIEGNKDNPTSYSKYKVKPGTNLKDYKIPGIDSSVVDSIKVTPQKGYTDPVWRDSKNGTDFVATTKNYVFTATATKTYDITFDANSGSGTKDKVTQKVNTEYELPAKDTFTPPNENQEFSGWQIGDDSKNLKKAGDKIKITGDIIVKAIWKAIEYKVKFQTEAGATGSMDEKTVKKGDSYELPKPTFTPDKGKEFAGWKVGDGTELKQAGDKIDITGNVTLTATWKDVMVNVSYNANGGSGKMEGKELKKGSTLTLPGNGFTAPENQEFDTWEVNGKKVAPGTEITIEKDTVIKAIWKNKPGNEEYKVSFEAGEGASGKMNDAPVKNGDKYELPKPTFTPDKGKEFAGWKVGDGTELKQVGEKIDITGNVTLTATWKTKPGTDEPGTKPDPNQPGTKPGEDKPNEPGEDDFYIPEFKIHEEVVPTYPVYAVVPKTEKVEKAEEVPVSLETHKAYIAGYEDNTLRAEGNITRAEAAAMVTRLAGLDLSDTSMPAFKDMQKNAWYFRYINAAVKAKMLDADNGMMRPNDKITRAEFAKMLAAIDKENSSVSKFDDIKGHRYEKEINKIYGNNRIEGYEDGSFRPDAYLTRAESAAFLNRMFNRIADKEAYAGLEDKLARFKDFDSSKWYYDEMVEATNSHELTRRGKASDKFGRVYEKWTRILPSDVK